MLTRLWKNCFAKFCKSKVELWKIGERESRRATEDRDGGDEK